jgi:hypothetical protein
MYAKNLVSSQVSKAQSVLLQAETCQGAKINLPSSCSVGLIAPFLALLEYSHRECDRRNQVLLTVLKYFTLCLPVCHFSACVYASGHQRCLEWRHTPQHVACSWPQLQYVELPVDRCSCMWASCIAKCLKTIHPYRERSTLLFHCEA